MSELRRDPISGRWNIVEVVNPSGPEAFARPPAAPQAAGRCPFCPGHETLTPPEIYAVRRPGSAPDGEGWSLRVTANKFPALQIEGALGRRGLGVFDLCNGVGAHEVIVETPDHARQLADLSIGEVAEAIRAYAARSLDLRGDPRLKYTLLFKNHGLEAGASLEHSHSQLIALPIVPKRVQEELRGAERYFEFRERCAYCDMLRQELQEDERIVSQNRSFVAYCPYVSSFPFEVWFLPRAHDGDFARIGADATADFAALLQDVLRRLRTVLRDPPYNYIIHTAPIEPQQREEYHWHVELIPKLVNIAGFEWGTGFYINPTPPELAAKWLREAVVA